MLSYILKAQPIIVLGDVMLDKYISGSVSRISPEAPVPVLRHLKEDRRLGGAANVALNIAAVGGECHLLGIIGHDGPGQELEVMAQAAGVKSQLVRCESRHTITKTRVLAGQHHQFLRIDQETTGDFPEKTETALIERLETVVAQGVGALVISDYAKGCLSDRLLERAIGIGRQYGIPVMIDPKRTEFSAYAKADFIKPNVSELAKSLGMPAQPAANVIKRAEEVARNLGTNVLLTMSEQGMGLFSRDGAEPIMMSTLAQEVFDVSGAGDTVIAIFSLMIAGGAGVRQAMHVANVAAGIVVSKVGTASLTAQELSHVLHRHDEETGNAHLGLNLDWTAMHDMRERWRTAGLEVGFTNGCFDLLHPGHIRILKGAKRHCDRLIVALNTDASVKRLKGPQRPVQDQFARAEVIGALEAVDAVVFFEEETPLNLIRLLEPDVLIKGADYTEEQIAGADVVKSLGGRVERVDLLEGHSTSTLIDRSQAKPEGSTVSEES